MKIEIASSRPDVIVQVGPRNNDLRNTLLWTDNPDIRKLLDVIADILANEYIEVAKNNKEVFETGGSK